MITLSFAQKMKMFLTWLYKNFHFQPQGKHPMVSEYRCSLHNHANHNWQVWDARLAMPNSYLHSSECNLPAMFRPARNTSQVCVCVCWLQCNCRIRFWRWASRFWPLMKVQGNIWAADIMATFRPHCPKHECFIKQIWNIFYHVRWLLGVLWLLSLVCVCWSGSIAADVRQIGTEEIKRLHRARVLFLLFHPEDTHEAKVLNVVSSSLAPRATLS